MSQFEYGAVPLRNDDPIVEVVTVPPRIPYLGAVLDWALGLWPLGAIGFAFWWFR